MKLGFILLLSLLIIVACARPFTMCDIAMSASMDKVMAKSQSKKEFINDVKKIISEKGNVNVLSDAGFPLLFHALIYEDVETIDLLLSHGADPVIRSKTGAAAMCGLRWNRDESVISRVLEKVKDVNQPCESIGSVISNAASMGNYAAVKQLINRDARIDIADEIDGWSTLMWAVEGGNINVINLILQKGAEINFKSKNGETALSVAEKFHFTEIVELLKQKGAKN